MNILRPYGAAAFSRDSPPPPPVGTIAGDGGAAMAKTPAINVAVVIVTPGPLIARDHPACTLLLADRSIAPAYQHRVHRSRVTGYLSDAWRKIRVNADDQSRVVSGYHRLPTATVLVLVVDVVLVVLPVDVYV